MKFILPVDQPRTASPESKLNLPFCIQILINYYTSRALDTNLFTECELNIVMTLSRKASVDAGLDPTAWMRWFFSVNWILDNSDCCLKTATFSEHWWVHVLQESSSRNRENFNKWKVTQQRSTSLNQWFHNPWFLEEILKQPYMYTKIRAALFFNSSFLRFF